MELLNKSISGAVDRPVKVLQFGEGNFLRGFVDYMIDVANEKGVFNGSVAIVKPIAYGNLNMFHEQENQYTVVLRGKEDGAEKVETRVITSIADAVDCIEEYEKYAEYAKCPLITKERMFYETMEEVLPDMKIYISDGSTETLLPLEPFSTVEMNQTKEEGQ